MQTAIHCADVIVIYDRGEQQRLILDFLSSTTPHDIKITCVRWSDQCLDSYLREEPDLIVIINCVKHIQPALSYLNESQHILIVEQDNSLVVTPATIWRLPLTALNSKDETPIHTVKYIVDHLTKRKQISISLMTEHYLELANDTVKKHQFSDKLSNALNFQFKF